VLPAYVVDAWCVLAGGAHPGSSHGLYTYDDTHIADYVAAAASAAGFAHYREQIIGADEPAYRAAVDIETVMQTLAREPP
jgi:hypothetical protein